MDQIFIAAVVKAGPVLFDTDATIIRLGHLTRDAAGAGAKLADGPEGREEFRRCFEAAIDLPGPQASCIGEIARDNSIHLVVDVIERQGSAFTTTAN